MTKPMEQKYKTAFIMKVGRAAMNVNQEQFSKMLGVAKTTVAKHEIGDTQLSPSTLSKAIDLFKEYGIHVDPLLNQVKFKFEQKAIDKLESDLNDVDQKRTDYKVPRPKKKP